MFSYIRATVLGLLLCGSAIAGDIGFPVPTPNKDKACYCETCKCKKKDDCPRVCPVEPINVIKVFDYHEGLNIARKEGKILVTFVNGVNVEAVKDDKIVSCIGTDKDGFPDDVIEVRVSVWVGNNHVYLKLDKKKSHDVDEIIKLAEKIKDYYLKPEVKNTVTPVQPTFSIGGCPGGVCPR